MRLDNLRDGHVSALLPDYTRGGLGTEDTTRVRGHLDACAACRDELALRSALIRRTQEEMAALSAPSLALLEGVWSKVERPAKQAGAHARLAGVVRREVSWLWALTYMQAKLLPRGTWAASALATLLAVVMALAWHGNAFPPFILTFFVTTATAGGVALLYGPEHDPGLEVALATRTPPRIVLLSRFALALGYNVGLALGATLLLSVARNGSFSQLASSWLGPMLLLTGLSLLLSVKRGSVAAIAAVAALWCLRLIMLLAAPNPESGGVGAWLAALWQTTPLTLAVAALLCLGAVLAVPREVRAA